MTERLESNRIGETAQDPWTTTAAHALVDRPKKEEKEEENFAVVAFEPDIKDNDNNVEYDIDNDDDDEDVALVQSECSENMEKSELENQSASGGRSCGAAAAAATAGRSNMKLNVSHFEQSIGDSTSTVVVATDCGGGQYEAAAAAAVRGDAEATADENSLFHISNKDAQFLSTPFATEAPPLAAAAAAGSSSSKAGACLFSLDKNRLETSNEPGASKFTAAAASSSSCGESSVTDSDRIFDANVNKRNSENVDRFNRNIFQTNDIVDTNNNKLNPNVFDSNETPGHVCEDDKSPIYERMVTNDREYSNNYLGNGNNRQSSGFSHNQNDQNGAFTFNIMDIQQPYSLSIRDSIRKLMKSRQVKSVVFRYPRFAIKSYGKEKRYLCPPPHISIYGIAWNDYLSKLHTDLNFQNNGSNSSPFNVVNQFNAQNSHTIGNRLPGINGYPDMQMSVNNQMNNEQMSAYFQRDHVDKSSYKACDRHNSSNIDDYQNENRNKQQMLMGNFNFSNAKNNTDCSFSAISSTYDRFGDRMNRIYSTISLPGVSLPDDGHIDLDENNQGYATRIFIPENKDLNQSIVLNSANSFTFLVSLCINNAEICSFSSSQIKLKSKALSYTKQALNNSNEDMCLCSGAVISLYSRLHAHKSNTRFLATQDSKFIAHPLYWDSYIIYKVAEDSEEAEFDVIKGLIHYGDYVKILSIKNDISLPTMRIRPINSSNHADMKPVQYLSRVSLQMRYNKNLFLCISNQKSVISEQAMVKHQKNQSFHVKEEAIWTLTKISVNFYSFIELADTLLPVSPFPVIENIILQGSSKNYYLKFIGYELTPSYTVWLGDKCCSTYFQSSESLLAIFPSLGSLSEYLVNPHLMKLPVFLIRQDLVVYPCQFSLELRFNSFHSQPNDFTFVAKYESFDPNFENPEIKSLNLIH